MSNRIVSVELRDGEPVPAEAVVRVVVTAQRWDAGTEARGRLMGPRCRFAGTIEVAYHLRRAAVEAATATLRAVIPEASFWSPKTPHLYAGPVELWQDGARCDSVTVRHGLRHVVLGAKGLRVNGHLMALRGRRVATLDDAGALALREAGYDLVVAPGAEAAVWEVADRIGLFVLGLGERVERGRHPSHLGWLDGDGGELTDGGRVASRAAGQGNGDALLLEAPGGATVGVVEG